MHQSNPIFWASGSSDTYDAFISWRIILSCRSLGYNGHKIYIYIQDAPYRLDIEYADEASRKEAFDRLLMEMDSLPLDVQRFKLDSTIQSKVDMMWFAPGMPGALQAEEHFNSDL